MRKEKDLVKEIEEAIEKLRREGLGWEWFRAR